ncbi:MAG: ribonuclease R, partial [Nitrospinota bacterium]
AAEIVELLGYPTDPQVERKIIMRQYELPESFPPAVENAARKIKEPAVKDIKQRRDLRKEWIVTIDGETAKDFDDAVSIEKLPNGYKLGVHIADVSNYVRPGATLDKAAYARGTSTYFPGSVIPMLPFNLSDDVCSLRPQRDRLTLSVFIRFDNGGTVKGYEFTPSVINSRHRMTYTEVAAIMENPKREKDKGKAKNLAAMKELFKKLNARRIAEGSIDFDLPEPEFVLNMRGEPENIIKAQRNDAHRLIEEFMLAANRCAADFLGKGDSLYRVHPEPDKQSMDDFFDFAKRLGHMAAKRKNIHTRLQEILTDARDKPDEKLLNFLMLRAMQQASYSPNNIGHFGLAFKRYTHFTSPIRRYPDLVVHRLIKARLLKKEGGLDHEGLLEIGRHCSERERISERAERDVIDALKVRFVADREGEEFDGIISGVTAFGIFVELGEIFAEGLMRLTDLHDDYYVFNEREHSLVGRRLGKIFRLGSPIRVRIKNVDLLKREVNLEPVTAKKGGDKSAAKSAGKRFGKKKIPRRRRKRR